MITQQSNLLQRIEFWWHVGAFILLSGAFIPQYQRMSRDSIHPAEGDPVMRIALGVAYLGLGLIIFHRQSIILRIIQKSWLLWVLLGWVFLSTFWSAAPEYTLRRAVAALLATTYGMLLFIRYSFWTVITMFGYAFGIVITASLATAIIFPHWGVMSLGHPGAWQGVMITKNTLGRFSMLALVFFVVLFAHYRGTGKLGWGCMGILSLITLGASMSVTAWFLGFVLATFVIAARFWQRARMLLKLAICFWCLAAMISMIPWLTVLFETFFEFFDRELTLTGRVPLWKLLMDFVWERPLIGYGYGSFWLGIAGPSADVWSFTQWNATHAHNGYLDVLLQIGLVGLIMSVMLVINLMKSAWINWIFCAENQSIKFFFVILFTIFFILVNISESIFLESGLIKGIYWVIFSFNYFVVVADSSFFRKNIDGE